MKKNSMIIKFIIISEMTIFNFIFLIQYFGIFEFSFLLINIFELKFIDYFFDPFIPLVKWIIILFSNLLV